MELSTMEIAARCNKSERTIQRWIKEGTLKAERIEGNVFEISEDDLQEHLPHALVDSLSERIASLESRLSIVEGLLAGMSSNKPTRRLAPPRAPYGTSRSSENDPLPEGLVPINDLIKEFNLPRSTVIHHMRPYLKEGNWKAGGSVIHHALDSEGVEEFRRRYART